MRQAKNDAGRIGCVRFRLLLAPPLRFLLLIFGLLSIGAGTQSSTGCVMSPSVRLVPPTVIDDPTLPAATIIVGGRSGSIHVREFGRADRPLLMVAPGSLSDVNPYLAFQRFADAYRVVIWDLRGNGLSERVTPAELAPRVMAEEFHAVKVLYSPERPATVVAHSWSADFAALYVGIYPEEVTQAVLIEPTGLTDEDQAQLPRLLNLTSPGYLDMAWLAGVMSPGNHEVLDFRMHAMLSAAVRDYFVDKNNPPVWPVRRVGGEALVVWERSILGGRGRPDYDFTTRLARFRGECLLVGSSDSPIGANFQKSANAKYFHDVRVLTIEKSGHRIVTEQWDLLEQGLRAFLSEYGG